MRLSTRRDLGSFDVAVVGSGFAGSILARCLSLAGRRVALVERGRHPRFALGESSTPLGAIALERLAQRHGLADLDAMAAWGRWRRELPELGHGLKRGFTFYRHVAGSEYRNGADNDARMLVAASPDDRSADLHWVRADVDAALAARAAAAGARLLEERAVVGVEPRADGLELALDGAGGRGRLRARRVVDASGRAGVVARALGAVERSAPIAARLVYAHVEGLPRLAEVAPRARFERAPYDEEAAAVHHLLDEGWLYVLRFDHGVASVGLIVDEAAVEEGPAEAGALLRSVVARYPSVAESLARCRPRLGWRTADRVAHRLDRAAGENWFALPHTLCFVDPIFSTGIAWSLHAVERLLPVLLEEADPGVYAASLERDADRLSDLLVAARRAQSSFPAFVAVAWIYFATASWLETRQRLEGRDDPELGFLGSGDEVLEVLPATLRGRVEALRQAGFPDAGVRELRRWAAAAVAPRDVVGWAEPEARNLYPVSLERLLERARRLGHTRESLTPLLPRLRGERRDPGVR